MTSAVKVEKSRRVIISLSATSNVEGAITTGVRFAAFAGSQVMGLFVEEDALHDLAGLPFAVAQRSGPQLPEKISPQSMAQAFKRQARMCREILAKHAERSHLNWSFSIRRGTWTNVCEDTHSAGDLFVLAREPQGEDVSLLVEKLRFAQAHADTVIVGSAKPVARDGAPVVAIVDRSDPVSRSLILAARWAVQTGAPLYVLVVAENEEMARSFEHQVRSVLGPDQKITFLRVTPGITQGVTAALSPLNSALVAADLTGPLFENDAIARDALRAVKSPFLLTRDDDTHVQ